MKTAVAITLVLLANLQATFAQHEKSYTTKEITTLMVIDGDINEKVWDKVEWERSFIQTEPNNGDTPTFDTQFKILYDQQNLYVAIRAFDKQSDSIVKSVTARDFFDGDYVEINIDSDFDKKDAFSFTITAGGIRGDEHIKTADNWFNDWNPNWVAKTRIDDAGWVAEMKIPFTELAYYEKKKTWGIQINRSIERLDEGSSWTSIPDEDQWVEYFGILKGIDNIPVSQKISPQKKISSEKLTQDFKALYSLLKSFYPSFYRYRSVEYMNNNYNLTIEKLQKDMTLIEFYKVIASFVSKIGDGHMKVAFPEYFVKDYFDTRKRFPFNCKVKENELLITESYMQEGLLPGAKITSIDGKPIREILSEMVDLIPSDGLNITGKYYKISERFDFYYALISDLKDRMDITYIPVEENTPRSINIDLWAASKIEEIASQESKAKSMKSFEFQIKEDIGVLTLRTFNDAEGFKKFVDQSFEQLDQSQIEKLIIDLRGNGGGEETNAIHLYSYLTTAPFQYYDRYEVGVSPNQQTNQETTLISYETLNFLGSTVTKDDMNRNVISNLKSFGDRFIDPSILQQPKQQHNFDGNVVVLIDGGSFSATSEFCAIAKRDHRAMFLGEETGGTFDGNTSGIYDQVTLPNSRLAIKIPLIKYVSAVQDTAFNFGRGILPDKDLSRIDLKTTNISKDHLLEFAIELLGSKK